MKSQQNKGKIKSIIIFIILAILLLLIIFAEDIIKLQNKKKIGLSENTPQAGYITTIGDKTFDITNAVAENANPPSISAGMIPVKWDGSYWTITTTNDANWYDYTSGQPAYMMLNDGTYQSELIQNMTGKKLAEENIGAQIQTNELGSIYMWLPRYAYNESGEILHIKQGYSVAGSWTMPEIFTYETEKMDFSLAGVWGEYNPLSSTSEVTTKIRNMTGEENQYGFIANTKSIAMNETDSTAIEKYSVGAGLASALNDITNLNRTILKITNNNQTEPIKAKAYYDETEEKIKIEVTYSKNGITKILDKNGNILSENSTIADTGDELIGNGIYRYIIIDNLGNIEQISTRVTGLSIYVIPDLETLKNFRDEVNEGDNFSGITVIQTADIEMNKGKYMINEETGEITFSEDAEQWVPISNSSNRTFCGTYNGNGHTISGIYINNNSNYQGLFGRTNSSAAIKKLGIIESSINAAAYVGGICGYNYALIDECYNFGNVSGNNYVGGICGYNYALIDGCYNSGSVSGNDGVGGILGGTYSGMKNCYNTGNIKGAANVGGIIGKCYFSSKVTINNLYNIGNINGGDDGIGGIVGSSNSNASINNSYNYGNINGLSNNVGGIIGDAGNGSNIDNCYNSGKIKGQQYYTGGICGSNNGVTSNCYNNGRVEGGISYIGGICGRNIGTIKYCYNFGEITNGTYLGGIAGGWQVSLTDSYNRGNIIGSSYVGGISGGNTWSGAQLYRTYNLGKITGSNAGGVLGKYGKTTNISGNYYLYGTADYGIGESKGEYGTISVINDPLYGNATALNTTYFIDDKYNINEGYPILSWQTDNDKLNLINGDNAFLEDTEGINGGYPILAWQVE